jgi:predicted GNAT family N-acyltransferase
MQRKFLLLTPRALKGTVVGVKSLCHIKQQSVKIKLQGKIIVKQRYRQSTSKQTLVDSLDPEKNYMWETSVSNT